MNNQKCHKQIQASEALKAANAASMRAVREGSSKLNRAVARLWAGDC